MELKKPLVEKVSRITNRVLGWARPAVGLIRFCTKNYIRYKNDTALLGNRNQSKERTVAI